MTFKERVENNVAIWLLGSLATGFLAGLSTYQGILQIAGMETISTAEKSQLVADAESARKSEPQPESTTMRSELDDTRWFVDVGSDNPNADMDMLLLSSGQAFFLLANSEAGAWRQEGNKVVIDLAGVATTYRATLDGSSKMIGGVGESSQGSSWEWTATKYP